jgi:hypothetical protein
MNDMTVRQSGAVAAPERNFFEQYSEAASSNRIVGDLLKFSKGEFLAGQNGDEVDAGTELVANLGELWVGWIRWEGGKPTDQQMGRVVEGYNPPGRRELGDTDESEWEIDETSGRPRDPWQKTNYLVMKAMEGDKLYTFTTSSKGGLGAVAKLAGEYGKRMRAKPNEYPVVALAVDSYRHPNKAYGKIFVPEFKVVGWVDKSAVVEAVEADAQAAEDQDAIPFDDEAAAPAAAKTGGKRKPAAGPEGEF